MKVQGIDSFRLPSPLRTNNWRFRSVSPFKVGRPPGISRRRLRPRSRCSEPGAKDYDVATDAPPLGVFANSFPASRADRRPFRRGPGARRAHADVEVATFRSDHAYSDGRPAGSPSHFETRSTAGRAYAATSPSIALLLDPEIRTRCLTMSRRKRQEVEARRIIRAIGDPDVRFREDHLRLLRAVRFAARFGFCVRPVHA